MPAQPSASQWHGESTDGSPPRFEPGPATPSDYDAAISGLLEFVANSVGAGAVWVSRDAVGELHVDYAFDRMGMGVQQGDRIPVDSKLIEPLRLGSLQAVIVEDVRMDMRFAATGHAQHHVGAFVGVALSHSDEPFIGVLHVVYPSPMLSNTAMSP